MSVFAIHQTVFLGRPLLSKSVSDGRLQRSSLSFQFLPRAASASSSSSVSGSGAEFSEQLLGTKPKQRRQKIAGIDQDELLDVALLADPDSCFCEFKGVQIHHKVCDAESAGENLLQDQLSSQSSHQTEKIGLPMVLLHGFGASVFSWHRVMKPLAQVIGSKVVAFDRPAFGLTSRMNSFEPSFSVNVDKAPTNPYSMIFSVLATLYFIDSLAAAKAILVGHSAGSLVAVETYFEAPERVAALILVAPAILAPRAVQKAADRENKVKENSSNSDVKRNPFLRLCSTLAEFSNYIVAAIMRLAKGMGDMLNSLYKKALSALLRSAIAVMLVRMIIDKFGIPAIRNSWYDATQITDHVLQGYTKPLRAKGWDRALVEFTAAMLIDPASESKPPMAKRLREISCPVLIITGDRDRLVPSWNSERLSRVIPGSCLKIIKNCGHLPHEERPGEFVSIVQEFLQRVFGGLEEQHLQAAT